MLEELFDYTRRREPQRVAAAYELTAREVVDLTVDDLLDRIASKMSVPKGEAQDPTLQRRWTAARILVDVRRGKLGKLCWENDNDSDWPWRQKTAAELEKEKEEEEKAALERKNTIEIE